MWRRIGYGYLARPCSIRPSKPHDRQHSPLPNIIPLLLYKQYLLTFFSIECRGKLLFFSWAVVAVSKDYSRCPFFATSYTFHGTQATITYETTVGTKSSWYSSTSSSIPADQQVVVVGDQVITVGLLRPVNSISCDSLRPTATKLSRASAGTWPSFSASFSYFSMYLGGVQEKRPILVSKRGRCTWSESRRSYAEEMLWLTTSQARMKRKDL